MDEFYQCKNEWKNNNYKKVGTCFGTNKVNTFGVNVKVAFLKYLDEVV